MQSKPVSDAAEAATRMRAETGFGPILDAALMAGRVVIDDRTRSITMSPPNMLVVPLTRRSGEMAASKVKTDELVRVPCWIRAWVAGLISYQRTWEPAPPKTACWVHSAVTPPCTGSTAETAWVLRASRVSSVSAVPGWVTEAGTRKALTGTEVPVTGITAAPVADLVTVNTVRKVAPPGGMLAGRATAHPAGLVSVWLAGTGVNAAVPSAFFSAPVSPTVSVPGAGQAVPAGGLVIQAMVDPVKRDPLKSLLPMSMKSWVSPSLG